MNLERYKGVDPRHILIADDKDAVMRNIVAQARKKDRRALVAALLLSLEVAWADETRHNEEEMAAWGWTNSEIASMMPEVEALRIVDDGFDPDNRTMP